MAQQCLTRGGVQTMIHYDDASPSPPPVLTLQVIKIAHGFVWLSDGQEFTLGLPTSSPVSSSPPLHAILPVQEYLPGLTPHQWIQVHEYVPTNITLSRYPQMIVVALGKAEIYRDLDNIPSLSNNNNNMIGNPTAIHPRTLTERDIPLLKETADWIIKQESQTQPAMLLAPDDIAPHVKLELLCRTLNAWQMDLIQQRIMVISLNQMSEHLIQGSKQKDKDLQRLQQKVSRLELQLQEQLKAQHEGPSLVCVICQTRKPNLAIDPCGHVLCQDCYGKWVAAAIANDRDNDDDNNNNNKNGGQPTCPICRGSIDKTLRIHF